MRDAPEYSPQISAPDGISFTVQPAPLPGVPSVGPAPVDNSMGAAETALGSALGKAGTELAVVQARIDAGQEATVAAQARTDYMTKINALRDQYTQSNDFKNAEKDFSRDAADAKIELLGKISDPKMRAETDLHMTVQALSGQRAVRSSMLSKEADTNVAGLNQRLADYAKQAAEAATPQERAAIVQSADADIGDQVSHGWLHATDGMRAGLALRASIDAADAGRMIDKDPQAALAALQDPKQFRGLDPQRRQNFIDQAKNATDQLQAGHWAAVAHFNPAQAIGAVGVARTPTEADHVFKSGILPTENRSGDNTAVSPKGAVGISQILPATAWDVARQLGDHSFDGMLGADGKPDEAKITEKLKADPQLNVRLGSAYWQTMVGRYAGNVAAAAAAYNAGPKRADAWVQEARAKFGPGFTAEQLQSVVNIPETRDYIAKVYKNIGAPMDGGGLSPIGQLHAGTAVATAIASGDATQRQMLKAVAATDRAENDFAEMFRNGARPDPVAYSTAMQENIQAARAGDTKAAEWVRKTQFQEQMAPVRDQAYRMAPADLAATVARVAADQQTRPVTTQERNFLGVLQETLKDVTTRAKSDPISLGERAQIIKHPVLIDPQADPAGPALGASLSIRAAQAASVQQFYGGDLKVLKPQEAEALKTRYTEAAPDEKFAILRTAGANLPPKALQSFLNQVSDGNPGVVLAGMMAQTRPELARQIVAGGELLKSKDVQESAKLIRPAFSEKLGGQVYPDPKMQKAVENAAVALYVARASQDGTLYDQADVAGVEKAIEDVTGPIVKRNGVKVPIAPSIEPGRFMGALDHLTERDVQMMGGAYDRNGRPIAAADISNYAVLRPLAVGSPLYVVGMRDARARDGFAPLFTASATDGPAPAPLVFNMSVLARQAPAGPVGLTPMQQGISRMRAQIWRNYQDAYRQAQQQGAKP